METPSFIKEYRFLSGRGPTYDGNVRAFVLQNHMQKRKQKTKEKKKEKEKKNKENEKETKEKKRKKNKNKKKEKEKKQQQQQQRIADSANHRNSGSHVPVRWHEPGSDANKADGAGQKESAPPLIPPILRILGQGRVDHFCTAAFGLSNTGFGYVDHCMCTSVYVGVVALLLTFTDVKDSMQPSWMTCKGCFHPSSYLMHQCAIQDEYNLQGFGQVGAASVCAVLGTEKAAALVVEHRIVAVSQIHKRLELEQDCPSDAIIHLVIGLMASLQARPQLASEQDRAETMLHARGLRAILAARGGWDLTTYTKNVRFDLHWYVDFLQ